MDMKEQCCPHCGSDDLIFESYTDELGEVLSIGVGKVYCNNRECLMWKDDVEEPIVAIRKSEFKQVKAKKNHKWLDIDVTT